MHAITKFVYDYKIISNIFKTFLCFYVFYVNTCTCNFHVFNEKNKKFITVTLEVKLYCLYLVSY